MRALVFFLTLSVSSVLAQVQVNGWSVPLSPTTSYATYVVPNIDGVTLQLDASTADLTVCTSAPCSTSFTGFSTFDSVISAWAMNGSSARLCGATLRGSGTQCTTNIAVNHISNPGINSDTPTYVFSQPWADTACQAANNQWMASTTYPMGWCIVPQTGFGTHYYVMSGTPSGGTCNSGGSPPSTWSTSGGSNPDSGGCIWKDYGLHAPLLDVAFGAAYPGSFPQWSAGQNYSMVSGAIIGCGLAYCSTHYYQEQTDTFCTSANPSNPNNWSITQGPPTTDGTCHWKDIGPDNRATPFNASTNPQTDTLAVVASAFPAIWETPYASWFKLFNAAAENHYLSASFPTIKYIRVGVSLGAEASTTQTNVLQTFTYGPRPGNDAQLKGVWTNFAAQSYLDNAATRAAMSTVPTWLLLSSLNCGTGLSTGAGTDCSWADAEAQATLAVDAIYGQVYGYGTQGLKNSPVSVSGSDLVNIQNGAACVASTGTVPCCSNNWCEARNYTIGRVPIIQLQECNKSTAAGGLTLCLDDQDFPYDASVTLSQVLTLATQHGTNVMEIYGDDLQCAFVPGFMGASTNGCQSGPWPGYATVAAGYAAAVQNLANGVPNATTQVQGGVQIRGQVTIQ